MMPSEAFIATQTEVLRQILQTQQQIAQQMNRGPPHGANHEGPNQVTTYAQFIGMMPPTFSKAEDPLEAEAWIKAIEEKFSAFVLPCSEENKANFAALQLRGEALMWWDHFRSTQRARAVTWDDFKQAPVHLTQFSNLIFNYLWILVHLSSGVVWNLRCLIPSTCVLTSIIGQ
jgi:hypothetical protein